MPAWAQQPSTATPAPSAAPATAATTPAATKVNINTADEAALVSIKCIGKTTAKAIIEYRQKKGTFKTVDEFTKVKGIGEKSLDKFKDQVTVEYSVKGIGAGKNRKGRSRSSLFSAFTHA